VCLVNDQKRNLKPFIYLLILLKVTQDLSADKEKQLVFRYISRFAFSSLLERVSVSSGPIIELYITYSKTKQRKIFRWTSNLVII